MGSVWPPLVIFFIEYVQVFKGRSELQDNIQAVLIFATTLRLKQRATQLKYQHCRGGKRRSR